MKKDKQDNCPQVSDAGVVTIEPSANLTKATSITGKMIDDITLF